MILRFTIIAIVTATVGLLGDSAAAQTGTLYPAPPSGYSLTPGGNAAVPTGYPVAPAGYLGGSSGCSTVADCSSRPTAQCGAENGLPHDPSCGCPRCHPRHAWGSFEALLWWGKGRSMPALVTTGSAANGGILPDAGILFGDGGVGNRSAGGARADFGFWFDDSENLGVGAKVWGIDGDRWGVHASSPDGSTVLARPFYNVVLDQQDSLLIASPGILAGSIGVRSDSSVIGTEAYLRTNMLTGRGYTLDLLGGYQFIRLDDDLLITSNSEVIGVGGGAPLGTTLAVTDVFDARNEFHGGELGVVGEARRGRWTLSGLAKLSVGNMRQRVMIDGSTTTASGGNNPVVTAGGLLALETNMGTYARDKVTVIPELNVTLAYELRRWLHLTVGYNAIYWSNVVLSGDQIDYAVNPTQLSGNPLIGPPRPGFAFRDTEYWLHGFTFGATVMY